MARSGPGYTAVYTVTFTVRKVYFDQIVPGAKTAEVRRASPYWEGVARRVNDALSSGEHVAAVFLCGRNQHRREILSVARHETAREALGREPSEQGKRDIGEGPVFSFGLGGQVDKEGGHVHTVIQLPNGALHGCTACGKPVA